MSKFQSKWNALIRVDSYTSKSVITCSTLAIETVEQGVKYVQS